MRAVWSLLACLLLGSCVAANPRPVAVAFNPHQGLTEIDSPVVVHSFWPERRYTLRSWLGPKDHERSNMFQLQIQARFSRRVYLEQAFSEGRKLKTEVVDRERIACGCDHPVAETVAINLDEVEIGEMVADGLTFEVVGRRKSLVMNVPAAYFADHLERHRQMRTQAY